MRVGAEGGVIRRVDGSFCPHVHRGADAVDAVDAADAADAAGAADAAEAADAADAPEAAEAAEAAKAADAADATASLPDRSRPLPLAPTDAPGDSVGVGASMPSRSPSGLEAEAAAATARFCSSCWHPSTRRRPTRMSSRNVLLGICTSSN
jgi:hypothetical protein